MERRAIGVALGRIRVAIYEETGGKPSNMKAKHRSCLVAPAITQGEVVVPYSTTRNTPTKSALQESTAFGRSGIIVRYDRLLPHGYAKALL